MENRIKEQQLGLFADRTSSATLRANQLRLYFSSFAYVLLHGLRRLGLTGTAFAKAQSTTIRLKLLKIGARLRLTARKVWLSFSEAYPYASDIAQILANLKQHPAWSNPITSGNVDTTDQTPVLRGRRVCSVEKTSSRAPGERKT